MPTADILTKTRMIDFSIITPSFNMLGYLKRCCHSVADQENVTFEHIVIDGLSTDGSVEWLKSKPELIWVAEKDSGQYDALNKGLRMAKGQIIAYLNCDEQYLPGTLSRVAALFRACPKMDILFGSYLVTDAGGRLLSFRKVNRPRPLFVLSSYLYTFTCAMFFRRSLVDAGLLFDPTHRYAGDVDFVLRVLHQGYRARITRKYLSIFTHTGSNMYLSPGASQELAERRRSVPFVVRKLGFAFNVLRLVEKFLSGAYFHFGPIVYEIYTRGEGEKRESFSYRSATQRWPS